MKIPDRTLNETIAPKESGEDRGLDPDPESIIQRVVAKNERDSEIDEEDVVE